MALEDSCMCKVLRKVINLTEQGNVFAHEAGYPTSILPHPFN